MKHVDALNLNLIFNYYGVVKDTYYPDNSHDGVYGPFATPQEAFERAKVRAEAHGFSGIDYWVQARTDEEDVRIDLDDWEGLT